ncbi:hypothetical protein NMG60_11028892 [Bertholletia excelsa]
MEQRPQSPRNEDDHQTTSSESTGGDTPLNDDKRLKRRGSGARHPVFRGVRKRRWGKWVSEIREPRKKSRIWLGSYPAPEMAARAHDVAAYTLRGDHALLNFPDEVELLPRPSSMAARDIQAAASKAARAQVRGGGQAGEGDDDFWGELELPELMMESGAGVFLSEASVWSLCGGLL